MDFSTCQGLRRTLQYLLFIIYIVAFSSVAASDFSEMFTADTVNRQFTTRYHDKIEVHHNELGKYWQPVESDQAKLWVTYSKDFLIKRVVDFEHEQVRLSYQGQALVKATPLSLQRDVERFLRLDLVAAYNMDDLLPLLLGDAPELKQSLLNLTPTQIRSLYPSADLHRDKGVLGDVLTLVIDLPVESLKQRADSIQPMVMQLAQASNVSPALTMAIIHQQSAFNFLANTSQPSLGLMLVTPNQAGEHTEALEGKVLYHPEHNIEYGIKKLAQLEQQFSAIENLEARQLCVIAAFRVGPSEVARVFTGRTSLSQAMPLINQLSARQVQGQFSSQLHKLNGGQYVQQVSTLLALYDGN